MSPRSLSFFFSVLLFPCFIASQCMFPFAVWPYPAVLSCFQLFSLRSSSLSSLPFVNSSLRFPFLSTIFLSLLFPIFFFLFLSPSLCFLLFCLLFLLYSMDHFPCLVFIYFSLIDQNISLQSLLSYCTKCHLYLDFLPPSFYTSYLFHQSHHIRFPLSHSLFASFSTVITFPRATFSCIFLPFPLRRSESPSWNRLSLWGWAKRRENNRKVQGCVFFFTLAPLI